VNQEHTAAVKPADPVAAYRQRRQGLDEMLDAQGRLRPAWRRLGQYVERLGADELRRRQSEIDRRLREDGATYHVYGSPEGPQHPWKLDAVPLLIDDAQWQSVARGLQQRARLLSMLLADLYGPQQALKRGLLPPAAVLTHPGFLRGLVGAPLPEPLALPLYACDLARGPDDRLWVLSDRVQAPSGIGYTLENRQVMLETQPRLYRDQSVAGLGGFRDTMERLLSHLAGEEGAAGLLTPGPYNETFFDQALLATYLGIPLLQGDDLDSSGGWLRMRFEQPMRALLRRVDAEWCDPLELRPNSLLGVPGMIELVRRGRLALINPLGSGLLENFALIPFLPGLARAWLGEDLELPQVATWWCGQPQALDYVLANFDALILRPIARQLGPVIFPGRLDAAAREMLIARIRARPALWVAQAPAVHSTAPSVGDHGLLPRRVVLRAFAAADGDSHAVMPGALVRTSRDATDTDTRGFVGSPSKDLWVLAQSAESAVSAGRHCLRPTPIPPRAADNLFWSGRYLARAEMLARALHAWHWRVESDRATTLGERLLGMLGALAGMSPPAEASMADRLGALVHGDGRPGAGFAAQLGQLEACLDAIRDRLPGEAVALRQRLTATATASGADALEEPLTVLWALQGALEDSLMPRDGGAFLSCGLRLERALGLLALLEGLLQGDVTETARLGDAVLAAVGATGAYRRRYGWPPEPAGVFDLLLREPDFARSVAHQLEILEYAAARLPALPIAARVGWAAKVRQIAQQSLTQPLESDADTLALIHALRERLQRLSDDISEYYFPTGLPLQALR